MSSPSTEARPIFVSIECRMTREQFEAFRDLVKTMNAMIQSRVLTSKHHDPEVVEQAVEIALSHVNDPAFD